MPRYRYTGDTEEVFPNLPGASAVLQPGDEIDVDVEIDHPRLEQVGTEVEATHESPEIEEEVTPNAPTDQ